jgi:pimeloyl-ACP methyl ester carboxylesterase
VVKTQTNRRNWFHKMAQLRNIILIFLLLVSCTSLYPEGIIVLSDGIFLHKIEIPRRDGSLIETYISTTKDGELHQKPVIFILQGSGGNSVFSFAGDKIYKPFLFKQLQKHKKEWHIICIEKRGVKFGDNVNASGYEKCSQEYVEHATKEGRGNDVSTVIDYLNDHNIYNQKELVLIGHSEGSMVAPYVAAINSKVTHMVLLGYSATHGLLDFLITQRRDLETNKINESEFLEDYDWLIDKFKDVHQHGDSLKELLGHTYKRWDSYSFGVTLEDLMRVDVPIFLGIPTSDRSAPAIGSDIVIAEFIKAGKNNLTWKNYIGFDHGFIRHENGNIYDGQAEVLRDIFDWIKLTTDR